MKEKKILLILFLSCLILLPSGCARRAKAPRAGQARTMDLIQLLPRDCLGVFAWQVRSTLETSLARHSLEDKEVAAKIEDIKNQTGIDLTRDIYLVAGGIVNLENKQTQPVALINLRYDQNKLFNFIKQKSPQPLEEITYEKKTIYKLSPGKEPEAALTFFDASNIFVGGLEALKKAIDVAGGRAENIRQNNEFKSLLKTTRTEALSWSAFVLPAEMMAEIAKSKPMLSSLEKLRSLIMSFDYKNKNLIAEIMARGSDESHHKQLADLLTGMRAMGVMAATNYPEVVEVLNRLEITSTPQQVSLSLTLPEDVLIKLSDRMKKEIETNLPRLKEKDF